MGDGYLRRRLGVGATAVLRMARQRGTGGAWVRGLLERKKPKAAAVALANKTARIAGVNGAPGGLHAAGGGGLRSVSVGRARPAS